MPRPTFQDVVNLANYPGLSTEDGRKRLRRLVADCYDNNMLFPSAHMQAITGQHGKTFRNFIDTVDRTVLWNMLAAAFTNEVKAVSALEFSPEGIGSMIVDALRSPNLCRPKQRGRGRSYGSHAALYSDNQIINLIKTHTPTANNGGSQPMANTPNFSLDPASLGSLALALTLHTRATDGLNTNPQNEDFHSAIAQMIDWIESKTSPMADSIKQGALSASLLILTTWTEDGNADHYNALKADNPDIQPWSDYYVAEHAVADAFAEEPEPEVEASPDVPASVTVDEGMAKIINASLGAATNGAVSDINHVLKSVTELSAEVVKLRNQPVAVAQAPKATSGTVGDLTYEVEMVNASRTFSKRSPALKFDVPSIVWRDASGSVVTHPNTPDIDPNYEFRIEHLVKFLTAHFFGHNIWLHGDTGTGKTTLAEQIAARLGFPVFRLNLDSSIERADIIGATQLREKDGVMVSEFVEGILPQAMVLPAFFILDEMDAGHADVLFAVQRALEAKGLVLTEDGGRLVNANDHFRFIATANTRGQGDEKGWYAGVRPMNVATLDRFGAFIEVDYLDVKTEKRLLSNKFPSLTDTDLTEFTELGKKIRDAFKNGELSTTMSPRGMTSFCQTFLHFQDVLNTRKDAIDHALEMVIVDRAPIDSQTKVKELARLCIN